MDENSFWAELEAKDKQVDELNTKIKELSEALLSSDTLDRVIMERNKAWAEITRARDICRDISDVINTTEPRTERWPEILQRVEDLAVSVYDPREVLVDAV